MPSEARFDVIACSSALAFVADYDRMTATLAQHLRPDGLFVQWDWELQPGDAHGVGSTRERIEATLAAAGLHDVRVDTAFEVTVDDMVMAPLIGSGVIPRPSSHERPYLAYCVTVSVASISQPGMIPANSVNTAAPAMVTPTASGTRMGSLFSAGVPVHTVSMMRR